VPALVGRRRLTTILTSLRFRPASSVGIRGRSVCRLSCADGPSRITLDPRPTTGDKPPWVRPLGGPSTGGAAVGWGRTSGLWAGQPVECGTSPMSEVAELGRGWSASRGAIELDGLVVEPAHRRSSSAAWADLPGDPVTHAFPHPRDRRSRVQQSWQPSVQAVDPSGLPSTEANNPNHDRGRHRSTPEWAAGRTGGITQ
jgi:hypothetical protein